MKYFFDNYKNINLTKKIGSKEGLRNAQLGAIHAIASYFTLPNKKPAIISMPTGSGKTSVLALSPFMLQVKRVLVITSSVLVRDQIFEEFKKLKTLKKAKVFDEKISNPKTKKIINTIQTVEDFKELENYDVVLSTPNALYKRIDFLPDKHTFDLLLIDEAHHATAKTWKAIIDYFSESKKILFTATPYRNDKKEIKGDVIYSYPLSLAYKDKIFGKVEYHPVQNFDPENKDYDLAKNAEKLFAKDKKDGLEHFIMVRTNTKEHADKLEEIYKQTSLKLIKIDSSKSISYVNKVIEQLRNFELDGIICVNMLGEGFDFPNLKIAAIHTPHKSLAATLQFIGRFARTNAKNIGAAKFIAISDENFKIENQLLYESDSIWQEAIIDLSEKKSTQETEIKKFFNDFREIKSTSNDLLDLSLYNLKPYFHAKIYKIEEFNYTGILDLENQEVVQVHVNKNRTTHIIISRTLVKPKWIESDEINDVSFYLFIIHFDKRKKLLFINSPFKTEQFYGSLISAFSKGKIERIPKYKLHRVLSGVKSLEIFNTGMQNRFKHTGETYRIMAGQNTENAIDKSTGRLFVNGHVFCKGNEQDNVITVGYSSGSKVWSSKYGKVSEYVEWCNNIGKKINKNVNVKTNTNLDYLPMGIPITEFPDNIFSCSFNGRSYIDIPMFKINQLPETYYLLDIDTKIDFKKTNSKEIQVNFIFESFDIKISFKIHGEPEYVNINDANKILVCCLEGEFNLIDYLSLYMLEFRTANDCLISEGELIQGPKDLIFFEKEKIVEIDWESHGTDIKNEDKGHTSIQATLENFLLADSNTKILIKDHGTGEIADFVIVKEEDSKLKITFYHVKAAGGKSTNGRVADVYEVCGQAVKSLIWTTNKAFLEKNIKRRTYLNPNKYLKGDFNKLKSLFTLNKQIRYDIIIVQPGLTKNRELPQKISEVLASTERYLKDTGVVDEFIVWGSK